MYTRLLIPLDGSKTAEAVLPYGRTLAGKLNISVELLGVVDVGVLATHLPHDSARYFETIIAETVRSSEEYLKRIAQTFHGHTVKCTVEMGKAEDAIIEKASDEALTAMATHGRSGINRLILGSVAEKVLRGSTKPLLLVRASEEAKSEGEAILQSVIVPLDGSELAENALPPVVELAKALKLEVLLLRAYQIPINTYAGMEDYYPVNYEQVSVALRDEAQSYLESKVEELKRNGIERVSFAIPEGFGADEIIAAGRRTPDNLIAMCTHGRSGLKRWVLGSVTEKVVRLSGDPVLIVRGGMV